MQKVYLFNLIIFLISSVCVSSGRGQTPKAVLSISGTVVDAENSQPLSFASVAILNKAKGTITNTSGSFELSIPIDFQNDTLVISMMGYRNVKTPIAVNLIDLLVKMQPEPFMLKEVEVMGQRITVEDIFKEIRLRIKTNYPVEEYAMECFYREIKKEDETYRSLLEAALVIRDRGYDQTKSQELAYLREVRGSSKFVNRFSSFWQENNLLRETLGLNAVRHPSSTPKVLGGDRYQLQGTSTVNDREVYVLVSDIKPDDCWQRTLYVDVETYAIHRSEESIRNFALSWKVDDNDSVYMRLTKGTSMFDFKTISGKLYLNHIRHEVENEYFNPKTKVILQHFTIINDLVVNDIYLSSKVQTEGLKKVENRALELQVTPYNESFWKQYNSIKQTPLENKIMNDLLREGALNDQFKKSATEKPVRKKSGKDK
jgi:hypothetical protein